MAMSCMTSSRKARDCMNNQTIATMDETEFDALVEQFIERGADRVTPQTFLEVMTDVAAQRSQQEVDRLWGNKLN